MVTDNFGGTHPNWTILTAYDGLTQAVTSTEKAIKLLLSMKKKFDGYIIICDNCEDESITKDIIKSLAASGEAVIEFNGGLTDFSSESELINTLFDIQYYPSLMEQPFILNMIRGRLIQPHGFRSLILIEQELGHMIKSTDTFIDGALASDLNGLILHSNDAIRDFITTKADEINWRVIQFNARPVIHMFH